MHKDSNHATLLKSSINRMQIIHGRIKMIIAAANRRDYYPNPWSKSDDGFSGGHSRLSV